MELQKDAFHRGIEVLSKLGDAELLDAYKRYVGRLEATLGSGWLNSYASMYQRDRRQLTSQNAGALVLPEEIAIRDQAAADPQVAELYRQYVQLLEQKKLLDEDYTL